jgi:N-acylneuraminate cytidylyltransferase
MSTIAIITARGGSKRIPRKNIKDFLGKPIIAYSIEAALQSEVFDTVIVSTDDIEIAEVAKSYGARVPFLRSTKNADDFATTADVLEEVLVRLTEAGETFDYACCIYPTAPFVTPLKLQKAKQMLLESNSDSLIPITKFSFPIWRSFKMEGNILSYNWPEFASKRSQDLAPTFHDCGQFYFFKTSSFLIEKKLVTENTIGLEIPESEVQDIDTKEDWKIAEMKYSIMKSMA